MAEKLGKSLLHTFGVADMLFILMVDMEIFYFAAFLTDYAQFSMALITVILWITGIMDILSSLAAGILLQRITLSFGGKYRSWFLVGPPLFAPLFVLQFTKLGEPAVAASIIIAAFILSHLLYNVVFTAGGSIVGKLSQLPEERTILSTSRSQGWCAAGLIFSLTGLPMITFFGHRTDKITGFSIAVAVYAVLSIFGYWYLYWITAGREPREESPFSSSKGEAGTPLREVIRLVFRNPPLLKLVGAETFRNAAGSISTAFAFYYFTYVLEDLSFMSVYLLATSIAVLIGAFLSTWVGIRIGKRNSYWISLLLAAVLFGAARFLGGTAWGFTLTICIGLVFASIGGSLNTALFSDTVIYGEWKTEKNIRAFTMALLNFPIKLSILVRSAVITIGLVAIGFVANTDATPGVVSGIRDIMTLSPAVTLAIAAVLFYYGYRIEDRDIVRMQDEIATRMIAKPVLD